ncbi:DUF1992 domain-containing protein [Pseudoruegeria sp. SHC-113]|uniref:DnaJ family domain-containing protein n=1 Tax=Pseudoruegeria sp. SHC-113 TaxID=2855439 RepID=UPI0021BAC0CA|nr:DUF1992 domain-containing protein [Pseudoruegeria sp. SHC-113]MCT8161648.1 DUF1992 domain-containing protein [Pseudoruegeria sp. SHC-113]
MRFRDLAERQIQKARAEGQLDGLAGEGQPLPSRAGEDVATAAGFRVMAEAGALPREITLRKEVDAQRKALVALGSDQPEARRTALARLADLELRLAIEQEARRKFYATQ